MARVQPLATAAGVASTFGQPDLTISFGSAPHPGEIEILFISITGISANNQVTRPDGWQGTSGLGSLVGAGTPGKTYAWYRIAPVGAGSGLTMAVAQASTTSWAYARYSPPLDPEGFLIDIAGAGETLTTPAVDGTLGGTWVGYWYYERGGVGEPAWTPPAGGASRVAADGGAPPWWSSYVADGDGSDPVASKTASPGQIVDEGAGQRVVVLVLSGAVSARRDRVRSAHNETIGSLMEVVKVQQAEIQLDEAYFPDVELDPTVETPFVEALAPDEVIATRYAVPVSSTEHLASYRARTNLGRIADTYPQAVVTRTVDIGLGEDATLTQLLDYLVELWEGQYPWLRFEAIPDLRFPVPDDPYTDPNTGTLRLPALTIVQEPDRRLSIRQIIDDFLSLIPGALRQTSTGSIEIVPFWGPDAPSEPALVLGLEDLASIDNAKPDPTQMFNGASVQARGGAFQQDQQLNEPSFAVQTYFRRAFLDEQSVIPTDRSEFPEPDSGFFASGVLGAQTFAVLVGGNEIAVEWAATAYSAISGGSSNPNPNIPHSLITEGSSSGTINLTRGGPPVSVVVSGTVYGFQPIRYTWTFRWVAEGLQVNVQANAQGAYNHFLNEARLFASIVEFDVVGEAFVPSSVSVTGRFSLSNGDSLPGPGGTNALATSEAMYGPRELQVSADIFPLTLVQAQQIAQALVVEHINPKTIRRFEQSWWNGYRVKPDHIGRLIELPTGEVGRVQDRAGRDDWGTSVPQLESGVAVVLTTPALDTSDSLLYDGGGFVQFDDGELAVRS